MVSAATAGMAGAFASSILAGKVFVDGAMVFAGPGEPLGAFIAAMWESSSDIWYPVRRRWIFW